MGGYNSSPVAFPHNAEWNSDSFLKFARPLSWPPSTLPLTPLQPQWPCCFSNILFLPPAFHLRFLPPGCSCPGCSHGSVSPSIHSRFNVSFSETFLLVKMSPILPSIMTILLPCFIFLPSTYLGLIKCVSITELFTVCLPHKDRDWLGGGGRLAFLWLSPALGTQENSVNICWLNVYQKPLLLLLAHLSLSHRHVNQLGAGRSPWLTCYP